MNRTAVAVQLGSLAAQLLLAASPPFRGRLQVSVGVIVALALAPHVVGPASNAPGDAQAFALLWPIYLSTLDKFLCAAGNGPEDSYWRVDRPAREARALTPFGLARLRWAAAMMFNTRGVRWNYEVAKLPRKPRTSRSSFLAWQVVAFFKYLAMSDLLLQLSERLFWDPAGNDNDDGSGRYLDSKHLTITHPERRWSLYKTIIFACGPYFFVSLQYVTVSIIAVASGLSSVEDWPAYFGNIGGVTTVRYFWGTFWHQTLRRSLTKAGAWVVDLLGIRRGTNLSSYTQIWIAFSVSGLMHAQSMLLLPCPPNITFGERTLGVFAFFIWQAAAITLEDSVQWIWGRRAPSVTLPPWATGLVGRAWVIFSFYFSLPWAADAMMRSRLTEESFLGFSITRGLVQYAPVPPQ